MRVQGGATLEAKASGLLGRRDRWSTLAAFGGAAIPISGVSVALLMFLPQFYASELGVPLAVVGGIFAIGKLAALIFDPLVGVLIDRTRSVIGRFRPWLLLAGPIVMIASYRLFAPPDDVNVTYIGVWLTALVLGMSLWGVSHGTWAATLSTDYDGRNRIYAVTQSAGMIGVLTSVVGTTIATQIGGDNQTSGMRAVALFVLIAIPLTGTLALIRTPEGQQPQRGTAVRLGDIKDVALRSVPLRLLAAQLFIGLGGGMLVASYRFLFTADKGFTNSEANALLLVTILGGLVSPAAALVVAQRIGKDRTLIAAIVGVCACLIMLLAAPPGVLWVTAVILFMTNLSGGAPAFLLFSMSADAADEYRLNTGRDRTGILYSLISTSGKLAAAASVYLAFTLLAWAGFDPTYGAENTSAALLGLYICFAGAPIALYTIGAAMMFRYPITSARHAEIKAALEAADILANKALQQQGPDDLRAPSPAT